MYCNFLGVAEKSYPIVISEACADWVGKPGVPMAKAGVAKVAGVCPIGVFSPARRCAMFVWACLMITGSFVLTACRQEAAYTSASIDEREHGKIDDKAHYICSLKSDLSYEDLHGLTSSHSS